MKKYLFIMMCSLLASSLVGCNSDGDSEKLGDEYNTTKNDTTKNDTTKNDTTKNDTTKNDTLKKDFKIENALSSFSQSGCKKAGTRSVGNFGEESIDYESTEDGYLILQHNNAVFCCEVNITVTAFVNNDTVNITEQAPPLTNCLCPYDLTMKVGPLKDGDYTIVIDDGALEKKSFSIQFNPTTKGTFNISYENL